MQSDDGGSPTTCFGGRIAVLDYETGACQNGADNFALHSDAAPVDDADEGKAEPMGLAEVLLDYEGHVARRDAVKIENIGDGNAERDFIVHLRIQSKRPGQPKPTGPLGLPLDSAHLMLSDLL